MRLALLPVIGFRNIHGESDYVMYRNMALDLHRMEPDVFSYMCLPRSAVGQARNESGLYNLFTEGPTAANDRGGFHDMLATSSMTFLDLFGPRNCLYPIDAVITSRTDVVPSLARWLWDWRGGREVIPVIVIDPQVCNIEIVDSNETWLLNRTLGYVMGWPVFNTEHEKEMALEAASKYLQASLMRKLEKRSIVIACTVAFADLDRAMQRNSRAERFTLVFGGRLNAHKRADKLVRLYDEFYRGGRDVDIVICSPKTEARMEVPSYMKLYTDLPRSDFLDQIARAHVYLNTSDAEGFSVGFVEQVYTVPVSIVPDKPWVRSLLGDAFEHHPFVYRGLEEARAYLRYAYEHFDEAAKRLVAVKNYLRKRYDNELVASQILMVARDVVSRCQSSVGIGDVQQDLLWRAFNSLPDCFSFHAFWERFKRKSISSNEVPQLGELWKWQAYVWLRTRVRDLANGPEPFFEKVSA